jgi:hypothetical protein
MWPSIEKPENDNWGLDSTGLAKSTKICKMTGTGTAMAHQARAGQGIWLFSKKIEAFILSNPGLLAGYLVLLLTLAVAGNMSQLLLTQKTATTAMTIGSIRSTWVFRMGLTKPRILCWSSTYLPSPRWWVALHSYLRYFTHEMWWHMCTITMTPGVHSLHGLQSWCNSFNNPWRCLCLLSANRHIFPLSYYCILDTTLSPYTFSFDSLSLIAIQSSLWMDRLQLHLLSHYRNLQVWNIWTNLHTL